MLWEVVHEPEGKISMSQQYRICRTCGASLRPGYEYCPRCGAQYDEPIGQQPYPPEQPAVPGPAGQYAAQQPLFLPPLPPKTPYPAQDQGYAPSPSYPPTYAQQAPMTAWPGQRGDSPQPPPPQSRKGISPGLLILIAVLALLLLISFSALFYNIGEHNGSQPGNTPTPAPTYQTTPRPTRTPKPVPTRTPGSTPTSPTLPTPTPGLVVDQLFTWL